MIIRNTTATKNSCNPIPVLFGFWYPRVFQQREIIMWLHSLAMLMKTLQKNINLKYNINDLGDYISYPILNLSNNY